MPEEDIEIKEPVEEEKEDAEKPVDPELLDEALPEEDADEVGEDSIDE